MRICHEILFSSFIIFVISHIEIAFLYNVRTSQPAQRGDGCRLAESMKSSTTCLVSKRYCKTQMVVNMKYNG